MNNLAIVVLVCAALMACNPNASDGGKGADPKVTVDVPAALPRPFELIVEAERMTAEGCFVGVKDKAASGEKAMQVPPKGRCVHVTKAKDPKPMGSLKRSFTLDAPTKVSIWFRVRWDDTCSNSFTAVLPNGMKKTVTSSTLKKWVWIDVVKAMPLKAGTHELVVNAREFGARIDQLLVIDDDTRIPRGVATNFNEMSKE